MKKALFFGLLAILLAACNTKPLPKFNLTEDIYNFTEKLPEGDTILVNISLSVCMAKRSDSLLLFKENGKVYMQLNVRYGWQATDTLILPKHPIKPMVNDTLQITSWFKYLKKTEPTADKRPLAQLIYKTDTLYFYHNGLGSKIEKTQYYYSVITKQYPYEKGLMPIPPPAPEEIEIITD